MPRAGVKRKYFPKFRSKSGGRRLKHVSRFRRRRVRLIRNRFSPLFMPQKYICRLKYAQEISLNSSGSGAVCQSFRANDLYDPDQTGGGHQPMGFDQLAALYSKFTVIGSKIEMWPVVTSTTAGTPSYYGLRLTDTVDDVATKLIGDIMEQEKVSAPAPIAMNQQVGSTTSFAGKRQVKFSLKKFFKVKSCNDTNFQCTSAASPTTQAYFVCWNVGVGNADAVIITYFVRITYIVMCTLPKLVSQS